MKRIYQFIIIGGIGILLLILSLATPVVLSSSDFSVYNPNWNGCSTLGVRAYKVGKLQPTLFVDQNELTVNQQSFVKYMLSPEASVIILLGPREPFDNEELNYLRSFLQNGGRLLLADDFGSGNQILAGINATTRFSGKLLLDLSFEKNASFVTVYEFPQPTHMFVNNVSSVLLNYPSSLQVGRNTTVIARSSSMSWLDATENGVYDSNEAQGPFPVLAIEKIGAGELILCSTPSIMINSMRDHADNRNFRDNLFTYIFKDRNTVIFDESHRDIATPLQISYFFPSVISLPVKIGILLVVVFLFLAWFTPIPTYLIQKVERLLIRSSDEHISPKNEQVIEDLLKRHPTWNRQKLNELIERMEQ